MSESGFCDKCGAALDVGARLCSACGAEVASRKEPLGIPSRPAEPRRSAAVDSKSTLRAPPRAPWVLAKVGVVAVLVCMVVAVFGFMYSQSQRGSIVAGSTSTPEIAMISTRVPTSVLPSSAAPTATVTLSIDVLPSPTLPPLTPPRSPTTPLPIPLKSPIPPTTTVRRTATPPQGTATPVPGVYVQDVRFSPSPPQRGSPMAFVVNFRNTTGQAAGYRVIIYIYRPGNFANSFGETTVTDVSVPDGTNDRLASYGFVVSGGGGCEDFVARIAWLDQDKKPTVFNRPDGKMFEKTFTVCP